MQSSELEKRAEAQGSATDAAAKYSSGGHMHEAHESSPLIAGSSKQRACCDDRTRTTSLLFTVTCFLFMDQNLLAPNLTDVAHEFKFTDTERDQKLGGEISLSLFLVGAPVALLVGYYADRVNRRNLYAAVVILGEVGCFLTLWVDSYWQLFCLRALTGISLGGSIPLVFSMISDLYRPEERPAVSAAMGVAMGIGQGIGQGVAAVFGDLYFGWRTPFAIVAVPSCLSGVAFVLFAKEPKRGACDAVAAVDAEEGAGRGGLAGEGAELSYRAQEDESYLDKMVKEMHM